MSCHIKTAHLKMAVGDPPAIFEKYNAFDA